MKVYHNSVLIEYVKEVLNEKKFQIQKTTTLTGVNNWVNVGDHIEGNHVNFRVGCIQYHFN